MNLRDFAKDQPCVRCYKQDGTVVLAHYCGPRQHHMGKGMSIKGGDVYGAHLCAECHTYFDQYKDGNTVERSEEFLFLCLLTARRVITAMEAA